MASTHLKNTRGHYCIRSKQYNDMFKTKLDEAITTQVQKVPVNQVGVHFLRFCGKYDLQRISTSAESHSEYLNAAY